MRKRKVVVISAAMAGVAMLLAMSIWPSRCPVELKLVGGNPMMNDDGNEARLVTLSVSNRGSVSIMFERLATFQAKVRGRWIEVQQAVDLDRVAPNQKGEEMLVVPEGTEACRFRLNYQSETWKSRLMVSLGPTGRTWVAKSPWLRKCVWPDQYKTMRTPPRWKQTTLETQMPQSERKTVGISLPAHFKGPRRTRPSQHRCNVASRGGR